MAWRYQLRRMNHPVSAKAMAMTASWPNSTPDVEAHERHSEALGGDAVIAQHAGKAQPVQKPEGEDQRGAPARVAPSPACSRTPT